MLDVKKLLAKVADWINDTDTVTTQTLSWNTGTAGSSLRLMRWGKVCQLSIVNPSQLAVGNNIVATIPVGYRPGVTVYVMLAGPKGEIAVGDTHLSIRATVSADGTINLYNYRSTAISGSTNQSATISWIVGGGST